jgi:hypothetical protein
VCLLSSIGFSASAIAANTSLSTLATAFKAKKHADASVLLQSDEITMGYAGEDVANRLMLPIEIAA